MSQMRSQNRLDLGSSRPERALDHQLVIMVTSHTGAHLSVVDIDIPLNCEASL